MASLFPSLLSPTPPRGLLGFSGIMGAQPPAGLLGRYYDPAEERRRKIAGAMTQAGIQLLTNGRGSFGEVLGQGLAGAVQGANNAGINYREDAMGYQQLEQQMADRQRQIENDQFDRGRLIKQDAWSNTEHQRTLDERQRADAERKARHGAIVDWASKKPPEFLDWAQNFPEEAAKMYAAEMMPPENKEPTDDIREYQFYTQQSQAAGQPPVDFYTWQKSKTPQTTITNSMGGEVGTIPQGFELFTDPKTGGRSMRPIQGGPAWAEQQDILTKQQNRIAGKTTAGDIVTDDIDRAMKEIKSATLPTTGFFGNILSGVGSTASHNVQALTNSVRANIGFDRLQQMRESSPTGGALGNISDTETRILQTTLGDLEQSQTQEQLEYNLKRVKNVYLDIIHGPGNGPPREDLTVGGKRGPKVIDGYTIRRVQ